MQLLAVLFISHCKITLPLQWQPTSDIMHENSNIKKTSILIFDNRREWVVHLTPRRFNSEKRAPSNHRMDLRADLPAVAKGKTCRVTNPDSLVVHP